MSVCDACLEPVDAPDRYHAACLDALFGAAHVPELDLDLARLHTFALAMVGRTSLSGVQRKVSLGLSTDRATLRVATDGLQFILKPQAATFPHLPENEHLTMQIARRAGLDVPPCALVSLRDGSLAYIVRRFDRLPSGRKLRMEDFCQLAERPAKDKYVGSAELCVRLVKRYATEPIVELRRLYRLLVVAWWTGNGDAHLKNFALLCGEDGRHRVAPAFDLLCTRLVIPDDRLALPVGGRDDRLGVGTWRRLAAYAGLPDRAAERVRAEVAAATPGACALVERSRLPAEMKAAYVDLLRTRGAALTR